MTMPANRCLLAAFLLTIATVRSQQALPAAEIEALELKSQTRYGDAARAFLGLLSSPPATADERAAAMAEYYATMATNLTRQTGDWAQLRAGLTSARQSPLATAHAWLTDALTLKLLQGALTNGDLAAITEHTRALDFLEKWWIIGPFDNERGGGYAQAFAPEKEFDPDASYDGKKRPVRWRRLPIDAVPGGLVDLDALVRPDDQVLCYAAVCLEAERAVNAVLHLGSDEAFRVFLNGTEVAARDVRRQFAHDQDAVALSLREGFNLLLLKVCEQEGGFAFAARLAAVGGGRLDGVVERDDADSLRAAAAATAAAADSGAAPFQGARTVFAASVGATGNAADALRLGYLLSDFRADDPSDRRDHRAAQSAVDGLPDLSAARFLLAFTRIQPTLHAAEKEENQRRRDYLQILAKHPDHGQALLELASMELRSLGAPSVAEQYARRALRANPDNAAAAVVLSDACTALELTGPAEQAITSRISADQLDHRPPVLVEALANLLEQQGRLADAVLPRRYLLRCAYTPSAVDRLARLLLRRGEREAAMALLEEGERLLPFAREPRLLRAAALEAAGDVDAAIAALQGWLAICPEDDGALVDVARLHGLAGRVEPQREFLRSALDLNPNLKDERRQLEFLEAGEKPFFQPYLIDGDAALAADAGAPADAAAENDPYYYLLDQAVVRAYRNGTTSSYRHFIARILTEDGARRLSAHRVNHYQGEQRARLLAVRVIKKNGDVQRPQLRDAFVDLPPLEIGDAVEIRSRVDDLAPSFFGDYFGFEHSFVPPENVTNRHAQLVLLLDAGREYRFQSANGAPEGVRETLADGSSVVRYELRDVARGKLEEAQPSPNETQALVRVTTYRDWNQFSAWWWNLIRRQSEVSPAMKAKVSELTAGLSSQAQKIAAIYDFVTTEIRYTAWEFGVHGYKPYSTPVIFERRHGDCKDKALLLNAMLSEIGVEAYPVLIWADQPRSTDDLSLPMVHHFNHCISYLPPADGRSGAFLDGTATYHPPDTTPDMDLGARVLVVKGPQGELLDVPWPTAADNAAFEELTIQLNENGDARVTSVERPRLNQAVPVRASLGNEPAKRQEKLERRLSQIFGKVTVRNVETSDLLDTARPVEVRAEFDAPAFASPQDGGLALKGALQARSLLPLARTPERQYALLLGTPRSEHSVVRYRLPAGWQPVNLPPPTRLQTTFGTFEMSWSFADGELRVERQRALTTNRVEPPEYADFREFATQSEQADSQSVVIRKGGQ